MKLEYSKAFTKLKLYVKPQQFENHGMFNSAVYG